MYKSPLNKVRKTKEGLSLKRWDKNIRKFRSCLY